MDEERLLVQAVAELPLTAVSGRFFRSVPWKYKEAALQGTTAGGRWSPVGAFRVLYLSETHDAVVVEAWRHNVDVTDRSAGSLVRPRALVTCDVNVENLLDLTTPTARMSLGLTPAILHSEPQGPGGVAYSECARVAKAAHQLGQNGIWAPSATHLGHTLVLFVDLLPESDQPRQVGQPVRWDELPPDPRKLRLIRGGRDSSASTLPRLPEST